MEQNTASLCKELYAYIYSGEKIEIG